MNLFKKLLFNHWFFYILGISFLIFCTAGFIVEGKHKLADKTRTYSSDKGPLPHVVGNCYTVDRDNNVVQVPDNIPIFIADSSIRAMSSQRGKNPPERPSEDYLLSPSERDAELIKSIIAKLTRGEEITDQDLSALERIIQKYIERLERLLEHGAREGDKKVQEILVILEQTLKILEDIYQNQCKNGESDFCKKLAQLIQHLREYLGETKVGQPQASPKGPTIPTPSLVPPGAQFPPVPSSPPPAKHPARPRVPLGVKPPQVPPPEVPQPKVGGVVIDSQPEAAGPGGADIKQQILNSRPEDAPSWVIKKTKPEKE